MDGSSELQNSKRFCMEISPAGAVIALCTHTNAADSLQHLIIATGDFRPAPWKIQAQLTPCAASSAAREKPGAAIFPPHKARVRMSAEGRSSQD